MTPPPGVSATADAGVANAPIDEARIMSHAYDGIREYDNPLPGWRRVIFWATIIFAIAYWLAFHVAGWGKSPAAKYRAALVEYEANRDVRAAAEARDVSEESLARSAQDPQTVEHGAAIFAMRCASCHTENGRGLIGPNLTDNFQIHGATRMDMLATIRGGVPGTAMLAWREQMPAVDVIAATAFVIKLRGANIKGKEPQGHAVEPFTSAP